MRKGALDALLGIGILRETVEWMRKSGGRRDYGGDGNLSTHSSISTLGYRADMGEGGLVDGLEEKVVIPFLSSLLNKSSQQT